MYYYYTKNVLIHYNLNSYLGQIFLPLSLYNLPSSQHLILTSCVWFCVIWTTVSHACLLQSMDKLLLTSQCLPMLANCLGRKNTNDPLVKPVRVTRGENSLCIWCKHHIRFLLIVLLARLQPRLHFPADLQMTFT